MIYNYLKRHTLGFLSQMVIMIGQQRNIVELNLFYNFPSFGRFYKQELYRPEAR